ncbi:MAG: beta-ketoacyl-ACP synthase III [Bacteroidota bacterium]|nr:beta-ketoacyl-ACP synthase III [Bacteroidota bacterium]
MKDSVYITRTASFLPNNPISNDKMECFLGKIDQRASKVKGLILRNNKIKQRYYALDENGKSTHSNAQLTQLAIEQLFTDNFKSTDLELLSCGTSTPDQLLPSHAAMVHGLLNNKSIEINTSSGVCCSGMNALQYAYMSVLSGNTQNAVCTGSEKVSTWMLADRYQHEIHSLKQIEEKPILAFKKDFLRWMLSDGAGAFLLEKNKPSNNKALKIEWIKGFSYAFELETCMYAGAEKLEDGSIKPWNDYTTTEWLSESIFSIKQDVRILEKYILEKGALSMKQVMEQKNITTKDIDYFLPHVSSGYFVDKLEQKLNEFGIGISKEKWFMNLPMVGNVGSASIYLMLDELFRSDKLQKGDKILLSVPESARFSYFYAYLTVV